MAEQRQDRESKYKAVVAAQGLQRCLVMRLEIALTYTK